MSLLLNSPESNLYRLAKGTELLAKAKQRKVGYQCWNKSALWFSTYEQEHKIAVINKVIERLTYYCLTQCAKIAQSL